MPLVVLLNHWKYDPLIADNIIWVFSATLLLKELPNAVRGRVFGTDFALLTLSGAIESDLGGWPLTENFANSRPCLSNGDGGARLLCYNRK